METTKRDALPSEADAFRRKAQIIQERLRLDKEEKALDLYLAACKGLRELGSPNGTSAPQPKDPSSTHEVTYAVLHQNGAPMKLEDMLEPARKFPKWESSGDDFKDKERISAALRRARDKDFVRTENGWDLKNRS